MNFWTVIYRLAWVVFAAAVVVAVSMIFLPKIRQLQDRSRREAKMAQDNRSEEEQVKQLRQRQEHFVNDPKYVERVAREELGKVKPGETIFRYNDKKTNEYRVYQ